MDLYEASIGQLCALVFLKKMGRKR